MKQTLNNLLWLALGIAIASFPAKADRQSDLAGYRAYIACRDKNPKVVTYECLRLNTLGFGQL